jgi:hypothetical protein
VVGSKPATASSTEKPHGFDLITDLLLSNYLAEIPDDDDGAAIPSNFLRRRMLWLLLVLAKILEFLQLRGS